MTTIGELKGKARYTTAEKQKPCALCALAVKQITSPN